MIKKLFAAFLCTSAVCATLMSPMVRAQLPKDTPPPGSPTRVEEVKVYKKAEPPQKKDGAAPFAAMKKAMVAEMQLREGLLQARQMQELKTATAKAAFLKAQLPKVRVNWNAQVQQFIQQYRPILRAEYHVVRIACGLTPAQRKLMAQAAEQVLRDAGRKHLETMRRPMTTAERMSYDPRRLIQEGLAAAVKAQLPAEQVARYQEELARRTATRKQTTVRNVVARLDQDLILSPDQRDKIGESLSAHWDDSWCQSLELFMYNRFLPPIPDQYVAPYLSQTQKRIWRSTPKVPGFYGQMALIGGMMEEDPAEEEELKEARLAAAKQNPNEEPPAQTKMFQPIPAPLMPPAPVPRRPVRSVPAMKVEVRKVETKSAPGQPEKPKTKAP